MLSRFAAEIISVCVASFLLTSLLFIVQNAVVGHQQTAALHQCVNMHGTPTVPDTPPAAARKPVKRQGDVAVPHKSSLGDGKEHLSDPYTW
jgi:hypothetical protein